MQVAIPEFDGRLISVPFSFKEPGPDGVPVYVADAERAARVAGIAVAAGGAAGQAEQGQEDRAGAVLVPDEARPGGQRGGSGHPGLGRGAAQGDAGGRLRRGRVPRGLRRADPHPHRGRRPRRRVAHRGAARRQQGAGAAEHVPAVVRRAAGASCATACSRRGASRPAGCTSTTARSSWRACSSATSCWRSSRRGGSARTRSRSTTTRRCRRATTTSLPTAGWTAVFGADAVVHLGKHGTLEWLPGKGLGLSASCAPDAVLGDLPLVYPFIVNDPGEGTQAKRRGHATIVDHLVPPMARADTYNELAKLEQLLDEHASVAALDPVKLPVIRAQIWELVTAAQLHHDLHVDEAPAEEDFDEFILHIDGYLCEIKDVQIRDGLHILGRRARGRGAGQPGARGAAGRADLGRRRGSGARSPAGDHPAGRARREGAAGRAGCPDCRASSAFRPRGGSGPYGRGRRRPGREGGPAAGRGPARRGLGPGQGAASVVDEMLGRAGAGGRCRC